MDEAELIDFNYSVRVVLGSSHISHMRSGRAVFVVVMVEMVCEN
jgi:hypothetical protein